MNSSACNHFTQWHLKQKTVNQTEEGWLFSSEMFFSGEDVSWYRNIFLSRLKSHTTFAIPDPTPREEEPKMSEATQGRRVLVWRAHSTSEPLSRRFDDCCVYRPAGRLSDTNQPRDALRAAAHVTLRREANVRTGGSLLPPRPHRLCFVTQSAAALFGPLLFVMGSAGIQALSQI